MDPVKVATLTVVGADADAVAERAGEAGADVIAAASPAEVDTDGDVVVAVGADALVSVARNEPPGPVLPVGAGRGVRSVPRERLADALDALLAGEWSVGRRTLLVADTGDQVTTGLFDVTLAAAPTHISEYAVRAVVDGEPATVGRVRADGVVVATPAGSGEYAHAAGGPVLAPDADLAAVVPISPYTVGRDRWVLDYPVSITVEREGTHVSLFVDGEAVGDVGAHTALEVRAGGTFPIAVVPEGRAPFPDDS
jgi:NAD+ kinase